MTTADSNRHTTNSRLINASPEQIYRAFTDPGALAVWQAPGEMTGLVHNFDLRIGGGYSMSLFYPLDQAGRGKTSDREDRFTAKFLELTPFKRIIESITFHSTDSAYSGMMFMVVLLAEAPQGTEVTIQFENIPLGIRPADNEIGTQSSLEKLEQYLLR